MNLSDSSQCNVKQSRAVAMHSGEKSSGESEGRIAAWTSVNVDNKLMVNVPVVA